MDNLEVCLRSIIIARNNSIVDNAGITFNRFRNDQAFQQGFEAGGRILGQGSLVLGRYGRTISEAPYDSESEIETAMDQEADLENWARLNGYWHNDLHSYYKELGYKFYGFGRDAQRDFVVLLRNCFEIIQKIC